jgi:hypothetical protein
VSQQQPKAPSGTTIIIGVVIVIAVLFLASRLFGGGGQAADPTPPAATFNNQPVQNNSDPNLNLGSVVTAESVDRDGCAVNVTTTYGRGDTFYGVLTDTQAPQGTTIFARLYQGSNAVEDSDEVTANQDYNNVCVNFAFTNNGNWDSGDYSIQFYVNGNAYDTADFTVR